MFDWIDKLMLSDLINIVREFTIPLKKNIPSWFLFSLPDGLWLFSYVCLMLSIWGRTMNFQSIFWFLFIPLIAIISEISQLMKIIPGTFDFVDLFMYIACSLLPLIKFPLNDKQKIY